MALPLIIYFTRFEANRNCKNPVTAVRPALVLSSYCMRGTMQVAKAAAGSDAGVFCLCAANGLWKLHLKDS